MAGSISDHAYQSDARAETKVCRAAVGFLGLDSEVPMYISIGNVEVEYAK